MAENNTAGYWDLFRAFVRIGAFTLGGGYAMIPLVREEVVSKRHWIDEEEFLNMLAMAQSAPGVMAVNTAIFTGYRLRGWRGVVVTTLGSILPSFVVILLIATVFTRFKEYPLVEACFKGIRPAVVALIAAPLWQMAKKAGLMKPMSQLKKKSNTLTKRDIAISWVLLLVPIGTALLIWLVKVSPILIILLTAVAAIAIVAAKDITERRTHK